MPGKRSPDLIAARQGLLDALEALEQHKDALVLVGAQAVYMWTDHIELGTDPYTLDADVALDLRVLGREPRLEVAMTTAGFSLSERNPGMWTSTDGVVVDLLVASDQAPSGGSRAARIPGHEKKAGRKVRGLEGALVDREPRKLISYEAGDTRWFDVNVAGPMALVLAKSFKIGERADRRRESPDRWQRAEKDTVDLLRLLMGTDTGELVERMHRVMEDELVSASAGRGLDHLQSQFGSRRDPGAQLLAGAADDDDQGEQWAASAVALTADLVAALGSA
jgi:hypothetical protein